MRCGILRVWRDREHDPGQATCRGGVGGRVGRCWGGGREWPRNAIASRKLAGIATAALTYKESTRQVHEEARRRGACLSGGRIAPDLAAAGGDREAARRITGNVCESLHSPEPVLRTYLPRAGNRPQRHTLILCAFGGCKW